jgi:putative CocE/NonD family hydrolase
MKPRLLALVLLCLVGFLPAALAAREAEFGFVAQTNVPVAMRDGVKLTTDLYFPAQDGAAVAGKFPVILTRTPYNKNGSASLGRYYAARGYVFIAQDTRGRYASEGVWHWMTDDGRDGWDCADWIGKQPWFDGKIGMLGTSYVGGTQHAMALENVPQLTTVIPVDAVSNQGRQSVRNAGAFEMRFWNWIMLNAGNGSRAGRDPGTLAVLKEMAQARMAYLPHLPLRKGTTPLRLAPEYEEWLVEAMNHGADDEFWAQNNIVSQPKRYKDMPVYLVGGWYDSWAGNTTANFTALSGALKSPVYLIMGPWIHGAQGNFSHGQVTFGKDAAIPDPLAWRLEWFDHWLKGRDNAVGKAAPFASKVRIFVMGTGDGRKNEKGLLNHGGSWRDEREWPLARTRYTPYYFHGSGSLSPTKPTVRNEGTSYQFDPKNPVPTLGGNISSGNDLLQPGAWDQRGGEKVWNWKDPVPVAARNDVIVFQTEPLAADVEVTGEIEVKVWASSSALDTDFTAKLIDVYPVSQDYPNGFELGIGDGIIRARFRETLAKEKLMEPGKIYPFTIKLYPTSNVFKKGHRIRVDVSSSNFPRFDVNPNTGEPLNRHRRTVIATNTLYHDRDHPSQIVLPVIPK